MHSYGVIKMFVKGVVGKKGELFPPKEIREKLGLESGKEVVYRVEGGRRSIETILDIVTVIKMPKYGKTTVKEFEKERKEILKEVIGR